MAVKGLDLRDGTGIDPASSGRTTLRLKAYDYAQPGAYFLTVCTKNRDCLFGVVVDGKMRVNAYGEIADACWRAIPKHFRQVHLDEFVVMPNHLHGILVIVDVGATHASPLPKTGTSDRPAGPRRGSLSAIVGSFKAAATKQINEAHRAARASIWQRNFYERVIRGDAELSRVREYIVNNPAQWDLDIENPLAQRQGRIKT